jgi:two-component system nitrate/nitrite response regulator NarL
MKRVPIATILVGQSVLLREGLARILTSAGFRILGSTSSVDDPILSSLPQEQSILLIIDVGDEFDTALEQIKSFSQRHPAIRVAVLAPKLQLTEMLAAFRAGAHAYLVKVATRDTFIKSLELVMLGVTLLPPEALNFISDRQVRDRHGHRADLRDDPDDRGAGDDDDADGEMTAITIGERVHLQAETSHTPQLSLRQHSILGCLIHGDSNKTIARKMAITEATVKVHVKTILRKIRVHNRTQAAVWAMSTGPFIAAKDDAAEQVEKVPVEPFPHLNGAQFLSARNTNGSTLFSTAKHEGANHAALPNIACLNGKHVCRNGD